VTGTLRRKVVIAVLAAVIAVELAAGLDRHPGSDTDEPGADTDTDRVVIAPAPIVNGRDERPGRPKSGPGWRWMTEGRGSVVTAEVGGRGRAFGGGVR